MASITWTAVFGLLIVELVITFILVVPVPRRIRNAIARAISRLRLGGDTVTKALLFVGLALTFGLVESYWSVQRLLEKLATLEEQDMVSGLGGTPVHGHGHHAIHHDKQRLYKAERNTYLAGFALTLLFVIGRILQLMQESVELEDELELARKPLRAPDKDATATVGTEGVEMTKVKKQPQDKKKD
ncbi:expressed unknown protein [Seminavis robusta]|uniref:Endoplasmic reticulum transmembrane protein n=1 Tax=Seminavis robusta TaxID=568900 RepID=A0A9N8EPH3_9STRA|nr:expressed unknown protein [Seminavis robusta]|eukprot:Sro1375_g267340.1 n/a (186) ;mRNA; f:9991-10548